MSQLPLGQLVTPAIVVDVSARAAEDPDFLLSVDNVRQWESANGPLPAGWLLLRIGWDERTATGLFLNRRRDRAAHAGRVG